MNTPEKAPERFSLKLRTKAIVLVTPDGKDQTWEIREMMASERDSYMDSLSGRVILNEQGDVKQITKVSGMHSDLLTRSLYFNGVAATVAQVGSWPASVTANLFRQAQVVNGLSKPAEEQKAEAKNA